VKNLKGTDILLDTLSGDIKLVDGDLSLVEGVDAISQHVKQRLKMYLGEWFLDIQSGVAWYQIVFVKNPNLLLVEAVLRDVVINTPGILELNLFELSYENSTRKLGIEFKAQTINGDLDFSNLFGKGVA